MTRKNHKISTSCWRNDDANIIFILIIKVEKLFFFFFFFCRGVNVLNTCIHSEKEKKWLTFIIKLKKKESTYISVVNLLLNGMCNDRQLLLLSRFVGIILLSCLRKSWEGGHLLLLLLLWKIIIWKQHCFLKARQISEMHRTQAKSQFVGKFRDFCMTEPQSVSNYLASNFQLRRKDIVDHRSSVYTT